MALVEIPQIPAVAIGLDGTELMECVQGDVSKQVTTGLIARLGGTGAGVAEFVLLAPSITLTNSRTLEAEATVLGLTDLGAQSTVTVTVLSNGITNAKLAQMASNTLKGNITGSTATPTDLSLAQVFGAVYTPVPITAAGVYNVPNTALDIVINKTDGANVQLGLLANKVGPVTITGQNADAHPFNVTVSDGNIMGALSTYPFTQAYQSVTFYPYVAASTWMT